MKAINLLRSKETKLIPMREDQDSNAVTYSPCRETKVRAFNRFSGKTAVYTYLNETLAQDFVRASRGNKYFVFSLINN